MDRPVTVPLMIQQPSAGSDSLVIVERHLGLCGKTTSVQVTGEKIRFWRGGNYDGSLEGEDEIVMRL